MTTSHPTGPDPETIAALGRGLPHPVYSRQHWVSILNPSATTFADVVRPLLAEATTGWPPSGL